MLRELIATAQPGSRLPSERELSTRWNAARMTVRNAMDALIDEGLVVRRHGSGTYVLPRPVVRFLGLTSFSQDMRDRGLVPSSRLLAFELEPAGEPVAERLMVEPEETVLRFTRLRLGSAEPMAIETVWIRSALVPGLAATGPRRLTLRAAGRPLRPGARLRGRDHRAAAAGRSETQELLEIPPGRQRCSCA